MNKHVNTPQLQSCLKKLYTIKRSINPERNVTVVLAVYILNYFVIFLKDIW